MDTSRNYLHTNVHVHEAKHCSAPGGTQGPLHKHTAWPFRSLYTFYLGTSQRSGCHWLWHGDMCDPPNIKLPRLSLTHHKTGRVWWCYRQQTRGHWALVRLLKSIFLTVGSKTCTAGGHFVSALTVTLCTKEQTTVTVLGFCPFMALSSSPGIIACLIVSPLCCWDYAFRQSKTLHLHVWLCHLGITA